MYLRDRSDAEGKYRLDIGRISPDLHLPQTVKRA